MKGINTSMIPQALKDEYDQTIQSKLKTIDNLIKALESSWCLENLKALHIFVHKITGSAGTYGYYTVSLRARKWVTELTSLIDHFPESKPNFEGFYSYFEEIKESFSVNEFDQQIKYLSTIVSKEIQDQYRETIPEKEHLLKVLVDTLRQKCDVSTINALRYELHKIAGSAGVYGFAHVSKLCKQFDCLLKQKVELPIKDVQNTSWIGDCDAFLSQIKEGFAHGK